MQYFKKLLTLLVVPSLFVSAAYAIDIEPEHDAIIEKQHSATKSAMTPLMNSKASVTPLMSNKTSITPSVDIKPVDIKPVDIKPVDIKPVDIKPVDIKPVYIKSVAIPPVAIQPVVTSPVVMSPIDDAPVSGMSTEQRIYYARSVTSNNPEYKTRFSILHNTPSPKRIAGERLYNLSDSFFRLAVSGKEMRILDNPSFKLTGINSGVGRYGEIKILDGAVLKINGISKRFKGNWDADGTGERNLKITPTNLVSGTIPVHIKTFKADGSVITDETHQLNFKALAMGPYNGYWSDGIDMSVFLWGMSSLKLKSQEMAYLGLDLGIVTQNASETTGTTAEEVTIPPSAAIAPIGSSIANSDKEVIPFGNGYATSSIGGFGGGVFGGGFGGGGFGGGFGGGGGGGGGNQCINNPNLPGCKPVCIENPSLPGCRPVCVENPSLPGCKPVCIENPSLLGCRPVCVENPNLPGCRPVCIENPNSPGCRPICVENPSLPQCKSDECIANPHLPQCKPDECITNPHLPQCKPDACITNPNLPQCKPEVCITNPNLPQCEPMTPVSEPFMPLVFLSVLFGYCIKRFKFKNT